MYAISETLLFRLSESASLSGVNFDAGFDCGTESCTLTVSFLLYNHTHYSVSLSMRSSPRPHAPYRASLTAYSLIYRRFYAAGCAPFLKNSSSKIAPFSPRYLALTRAIVKIVVTTWVQRAHSLCSGSFSTSLLPLSFVELHGTRCVRAQRTDI